MAPKSSKRKSKKNLVSLPFSPFLLTVCQLWHWENMGVGGADFVAPPLDLQLTVSLENWTS